MIKLVNNQGLIEPTSNLEEAFQPYGTPLDTATPKVAPGLIFIYDNAGSVGNDLNFSFDSNPFRDFSFLYSLVYRQASLSYSYTTLESRAGDLLIGYDVAARASDLEPLYDIQTLVKGEISNLYDVRKLAQSDHELSYSGEWASFYIYEEQTSIWTVQPFTSFSFYYLISVFASQEVKFTYHLFSLRSADVAFAYGVNLRGELEFSYTLQPFADLQSTYSLLLKREFEYQWGINYFVPLDFVYSLQPFADLEQTYDVHLLWSWGFSYDIWLLDQLTFSYFLQPFTDLDLFYNINVSTIFTFNYSICVDQSLLYDYTLHPYSDVIVSYDSYAFRVRDLSSYWEIKANRDLHILYTVQPFRDFIPSYHLFNFLSDDFEFSYAENFRSATLSFSYDTEFRRLLPFSFNVFSLRTSDLQLVYNVSPFRDLPSLYDINPFSDLLYEFHILVKQELPASYSITRGNKLLALYDVFELVSSDIVWNYTIQPFADLTVVYDIPLREFYFVYSVNLKTDFAFRYKVFPVPVESKDLTAAYDVTTTRALELLFGYDHAYSNIVEFVREEDFFTQNALPPYFPERLRYEYAEVAYATQKPALLRMWWRGDVKFWRIDFRLLGEWPYPVPKHFFVDVSDDPFVEELYETVLEVRPAKVVSENEIRYDIVDNVTSTPAVILRCEYEVFPQHTLLYRYPEATSYYDLPEIRTRTIRFRIVDDTSLFDHWVSYPVAFEHFYTLAVMGVLIEPKDLDSPYHIQSDNSNFLCYKYSLCVTRDLFFTYKSRVTKDLSFLYNSGMLELRFSYDLGFYVTLAYSFTIYASPSKDLSMSYGFGVVAGDLLFLYGAKAQAVDLSHVYSVGALVRQDLPFSYFGEKRFIDFYYTYKIKMLTADRMVLGLISGKFIQFRFYSVGDL